MENKSQVWVPFTKINRLFNPPVTGFRPAPSRYCSKIVGLQKWKTKELNKSVGSCGAQKKLSRSLAVAVVVVVVAVAVAVGVVVVVVVAVAAAALLFFFFFFPFFFFWWWWCLLWPLPLHIPFHLLQLVVEDVHSLSHFEYEASKTKIPELPEHIQPFLVEIPTGSADPVRLWPPGRFRSTPPPPPGCLPLPGLWHF